MFTVHSQMKIVTLPNSLLFNSEQVIHCF